MRTKPVLPGLSLIALLTLLVASPWPAAGDEKDQDKGRPAAAKKADKGKVLAIVGGDVYTVTREVIRCGTVLVKDGKIVRVGQDLPIPEGATVIDAKGKYVTPGF